MENESPKILNKEDILHILPQRSPILLIDRAELIPGKSVTATLHLDPEWPIFSGHFPEYPVFPGVYFVEAMAQAADLILLSLPGNAGKIPYFLGISRMRFLRPAYPGADLTLHAEITVDGGNGMYDCKASASVEGKTAASGTVSLALR